MEWFFYTWAAFVFVAACIGLWFAATEDFESAPLMIAGLTIWPFACAVLALVSGATVAGMVALILHFAG